jgi:hypothetical protein
VYATSLPDKTALRGKYLHRDAPKRSLAGKWKYAHADNMMASPTRSNEQDENNDAK